MARIRDWARALGEVAQSGPLRRAQASFGAMWASETAFMVGLAVVAFRDGGVVAVGVVTGARMAAAALLAPLLATVADRVRREHVLTGVGLVRAVTLATAAAVTAADGPAAVTYALAVVATIAQTLFRPAHSALLPALCTSPRQLTSANAVILTLGVAAGGPVTPLIVELLGIRPTLVGIGCSRRSPWRRAGRRCAGSTGACACATPTSRCCTA
jgi:MFS family permease